MVSTRRVLRLASKPVQRPRPALQPTLPSATTITGAQITARASYHEASEMQKRGQINPTANPTPKRKKGDDDEDDDDEAPPSTPKKAKPSKSSSGAAAAAAGAAVAAT